MKELIRMGLGFQRLQCKQPMCRIIVELTTAEKTNKEGRDLVRIKCLLFFLYTQVVRAVIVFHQFDRKHAC
jgi:hypothetical protein